MALYYDGPASYEAFFEDLTQTSLRTLEAEHLDLSVTICDDATIQPLNHQWRGVNTATDVLSFPQLTLEPHGSLPEAADGGPPTSLGDIVISEQTASRQADALGHTLEREFAVLFVHGLCHLLGHTHKEEREAQSMAAMEALILCDSGGLVARSGVLQ